jgi:phosphinothricin acetyltransferase
MTVAIRFAEPEDAAEILSIYAPYCDASNVSFETVAPSREQMMERIAHVTANYPWLVAETEGRLAGYVYATRFRERAGYRWTTEVAVYIGAKDHRRGVGRALYTSLFSILSMQNYFKAIAGITIPNPASVGLHESVGFKHVGSFPGVGRKGGQWLNVGWWQKELQAESADPQEPLSILSLRNNPKIATALADAVQLIRR